MQHDYWQRQTAKEPLFPDIEWEKPEQKAHAGRLGIIGGNKLGFAGVAEAFSVAYDAGIGNVKVLLPDALKKSIPTSWTDVAVAPSTVSGGLSKDALVDVMALADWSCMV
jgi:NAD(P)H-hydrate repair Nnr-like enzyme with NAD(P)H-hydrate dehydratase domain